VLDQEALRPLLSKVSDAIQHHRETALNPAHPHQRGTSQGPDIYFQMLEAANKYHLVSVAERLVHVGKQNPMEQQYTRRGVY
jgi:pyruvate/2-oxoacid:ferredoxin oxidoreductase alpha subunit